MDKSVGGSATAMAARQGTPTMATFSGGGSATAMAARQALLLFLFLLSKH